MNTLSPLEEKYFSLLADDYTNRSEALAHALNMKSALMLPKPTEHFLSDLHGEYIAFTHVLRNASGVLARYIDELFVDISAEEKHRLATILYYPEKKLAQLKRQMDPAAYQALLVDTLKALVRITQRVASKYDHEQIPSSFPKARQKVLNLLLFEHADSRHKAAYVKSLYENIIAFGEGEGYIKDLADLSVRYAVEKVHILGDIYDRGDDAEKIMDHIMADDRIDIQWGNHDIAWIGAAGGNHALVCNVIRIALRYNVLQTIEDGYGINLMPLMHYAENYQRSPIFDTKKPTPNAAINETLSKMHKAIAILQFKAEGQLIQAHPEYAMDARLLLDKLDLEDRTVVVEGVSYPLLDSDFPTIDPKDPYAYTKEEATVIRRLTESFTESKRLAAHIKTLVDKGRMYLSKNGNLLFHGCIPMTPEGHFRESHVFGSALKGPALLDVCDALVRCAALGKGEAKNQATDAMFYLWCGKDSPLFGKEKITTFERYFIDDDTTHKEPKDPYYKLRDREDIATEILYAFGIEDPRGKIINGHTPVKKKKGENPIKANGKVVVIDGGFAHAYRKTTGTAGYTLISNSYGILLATHDAIADEESYIEGNLDITSSLEYITKYPTRRLASDSDAGKDKAVLIQDLIKLAELYAQGVFREKA